MRFFYDCEFIEDGRTIDLISIGILAEDYREYYAVNSDMDQDRIKKHDWLSRNVWPHLPLRGFRPNFSSDGPRPSPDTTYASNVTQVSAGVLDTSDVRVKPKWVIANEVREFLLASDGTPELWADYGAYDHICLMQLWGSMMAKPDGLPMWTHDLRQELERLGNPHIPEQESVEHNALADARHLRDVMASLGEL